MARLLKSGKLFSTLSLTLQQTKSLAANKRRPQLLGRGLEESGAHSTAWKSMDRGGCCSPCEAQEVRRDALI